MSNRFGCCAAKKTFQTPEPTERKSEKKFLIKKTENALASLDITHSSARGLPALFRATLPQKRQQAPHSKRFATNRGGAANNFGNSNAIRTEKTSISISALIESLEK